MKKLIMVVLLLCLTCLPAQAQSSKVYDNYYKKTVEPLLKQCNYAVKIKDPVKAETICFKALNATMKFPESREKNEVMLELAKVVLASQIAIYRYHESQGNIDECIEYQGRIERGYDFVNALKKELGQEDM